MPEIIARRELIAVSPSGDRFAVLIEIGHPVSMHDPNQNWQCHLSITPPLMHRAMDVKGVDSLQALCLALSLADFHLREFINSGGRLLWPNSGESFTTDDLLPKLP